MDSPCRKSLMRAHKVRDTERAATAATLEVPGEILATREKVYRVSTTQQLWHGRRLMVGLARWLGLIVPTWGVACS